MTIFAQCRRDITKVSNTDLGNFVQPGTDLEELQPRRTQIALKLPQQNDKNRTKNRLCKRP